MQLEAAEELQRHPTLSNLNLAGGSEQDQVRFGYGIPDPKTVEETMSSIHRGEYLLPAIQREFVWSAEQITRLIDSIMRGYPVGSFLFWTVAPETARTYTFYQFLTDFHERDNPYAQRATVPVGFGTTAVLDGQQRLTALNIALYGSFAEKTPRKWWNSSDAFRKSDYLNLIEAPPDDELGYKYNLKFLTDSQAKAEPGQPDKWFLVGDVLKLNDPHLAIFDELKRRGIDNDRVALESLIKLYDAIKKLQPINYFLVSDQDPDKVLEIFVRVNSGGTPLSFADLLLSMATNQWRQLDAREEIRSLVVELNSQGGRQFGFTKDNVLKAALMLTGLELRFEIKNFTQQNMERIENLWPEIKQSLIRAASLLKQLGYSDQNLLASNALLPIAYYLYKNHRTDAYLEQAKWAADRERIRSWITRSFIKRNVWTSSDTLLTRIRDVIRDNQTDAFPLESIERSMAQLGKGLAFAPEEIDELLNMRYGFKNTFAALSLLYPGLDFSKQFHMDHVFPKSRFTSKQLIKAGLTPEQAEDAISKINNLPNLQLLPGALNSEKLATLPAEWVSSAFPNAERSRMYLKENDMENLPLEIAKFSEFYDGRANLMRDRFTEILSGN